MSELHHQRDRAVSFGSVADAYDRIRPTYPEPMVLDLLMTDPHEVLDVGCGTGRAARLFADRGCRVLGVEPDPAMAEIARGHGVAVEVAAFEQWDDAGRRFDLLVSGQAWHWVDPAAGAVKARSVLTPGGSVGLFWNMDSFDPDFRADLDKVYERLAPQLASPRRVYGGNRHGRRESVEQGLADAGFGEIAVREYSWQRRYTRDEYVLLLGTFSDHNLLPPEQREPLFDALGDVVDARGGSVVAPYDTHLITAVAP